MKEDSGSSSGAAASGTALASQPRKPRPTILRLTGHGAGLMHVGALVRMSSNGAVFYVSGFRLGAPGTARVWRWRPSPLPRRLP